MPRYMGNGPCSQCGVHNYEIPLTGETMPAKDGGTLWQVQRGSRCISCGMVIWYIHVHPAPLESAMDTADNGILEETLA